MEGHVKLINRLSCPSDWLIHYISHPSEKRHQLNWTSHVSFASEYMALQFSTCTSVRKALTVSMVLQTYLLGSKSWIQAGQFTANHLTTPYTENKKAVPWDFSHQPPNLTLVLVCSTTLWRGTELLLQIHTVGSNTPMLISTSNSGATSWFIDIDYVWSKYICTQCLPRAIHVYNVDRTLNEVGYIQNCWPHSPVWGSFRKGHLPHHGIGQTTIILVNMWLVEHNPEIDWCTWKVGLTRCPVSCWLKTTADLTDWQIPRSADNSSDYPKAKSCQRCTSKRSQKVSQNPEGQSCHQALHIPTQIIWTDITSLTLATITDKFPAHSRFQ